MSAGSAGGCQLRPATTEDVSQILAIWAANGDEIPPAGEDMLTPYLAHLMATGRVLVAVGEAAVLGFGAVVERAGVVHLADLFVLPDRFGEGIGGGCSPPSSATRPDARRSPRRTHAPCRSTCAAG